MAARSMPAWPLRSRVFTAGDWRFLGSFGWKRGAKGVGGLFLAEGLEAGAQGRIVKRQDGGGEQGGVFCAGVADTERAYRNAPRHLDDGEQGVEPAEFAEDGDAKHGEKGVGGDDTGEMGSATRARDNDLNAERGRLTGKLGGQIRGAMGGEDAGLMGNAELCEHAGGFAHGFPIGLAAHDDGYERRSGHEKGDKRAQRRWEMEKCGEEEREEKKTLRVY